MRARLRRGRRDQSETTLSRPWEPPLRSALGLFGLTLNPESGVLRRNLGGAGGGHNCSQGQKRFRSNGGGAGRAPGSRQDRGGQASDLARGSASPRADIICPNPQGTLETEDGDGQSPRAESLVPQPALPRRRNGGAPARRRLFLSPARHGSRAPSRASDHRASGQGDAPSGVRVPRLRPGGETHGRVSGALLPLRALRRGRPLAFLPPFGITRAAAQPPASIRGFRSSRGCRIGF